MLEMLVTSLFKINLTFFQITFMAFHVKRQTDKV